MRLLGIVVLLTALLGPTRAQSQARQGDPVRGKYLVERVAMCINCHTPHNDAGELIRDRSLQGAPVPFVSPYRKIRFANTAPSIVGLPQYSVEEGIRLLTTGVARTGQPLRQPMPQFRMTEQDAIDVITYLKSGR